MFSILLWRCAEKVKPKHLENVFAEDGKGSVEMAYFDKNDGLFYGYYYGAYEGDAMNPQPKRFALIPKTKVYN